MKIDRSKVKKGTSEVPEDCQNVIQFFKTCTDEELLVELQKINVWYFGKCELYHWIDVLDRFDAILAGIAKPAEGKKWIFQFDILEETYGKEKGAQQKELVFQILKFTALLIEHSYARHLYNSIEHLITLLDCADGNIILAGLNLVYVFSKRSNYLSRLPSERKKLLQEKLVDLAQTWGGSEAGCALEQCCSEDVPMGAGNVYFEYYLPDDVVLDSEKNPTTKLNSNRFCIDLKNIHEMAANVGTIMEKILKTKKIPENMQMTFYHRLRLAHAMANYEQRLQFVQARLQALSVLVYSNATVHVNTLVYDGLIEEIVNTLKIVDNNNKLSEVKASCLKTLTAIIHLDRNPRLQSIIDNTGATSYHGFLPSLVRKCILHMTNAEHEPFPQQLATSLFSFLYHLASYESGCEALVASGLIESLLKVVLWPGKDDHITFVTRAVRVIDLITNLDMAAFQTHCGLNALVGRLEREIKLCSEFHGPSLSSDLPLVPVEKTEGETEASSETSQPSSSGETQNDNKESTDLNHVSTDIEMTEATDENEASKKPLDKHLQCLPQRAALLKSILNFLKKAIPDPAFADYTRSLMDENLQNALKMIISNAEYYGALLFLLATDVITVFIFHEPSLLSSLQDSGLTWVVLKALLVKDVPATRENLASLPNTLSALCLNTRGLEAFVSCKPFERLFQILVSPEYLPAMKRRRSSDSTGDTAIHLGSAMDELMRHQPTLKTDAMKAIIKLLKQLCAMGRNPEILAFHPTDKIKPSKALKGPDASGGNTTGLEDPLSDDEMEEEYRSLLIRKSDKEAKEEVKSPDTQKKFVPVVDYVLNVMKFLDNILSNNGSDDHCVEFVRLGGLKPLYNLLNMPNFPLEFPLMPACQSIAPVCKSITMLAQESKVFKEGLQQLDVLIDELDALYGAANTNGSALLHELASTENPLEALNEASKTPLVHVMSATHAYINTFVFICRGALSDVRNMSIQQWGSDLGKSVLEKLCSLYTKLVWESSVLLTLCTPNTNAEEDLSFTEADLQKLILKSSSKTDSPSDGQTKKELTLLKWLLTSSSHLGRALAELFGLLVHQCVGTQAPRRNRPHNSNQVVAPSIPAKLIASRLTKLLVQGLSWQCPKEIKLPRLRLTFYICSVGFASPMLFDNSKNPYHLMLQQFQNAGGLDALFERFSWVVKEYLDGKTEDEIKSTVGIGEFFEGWLDLLNRMVNTKYVFDSTHGLPVTSLVPGYIAFNSVDYLACVHKLTFESIMMLWKNNILKSAENHVIGEKLLSILCHIVKGGKELKEKFLQQHKDDNKKEKSGVMSEIQKTPAPTTFRIQQDVNEDYLQQFVDMGFSQQHARDALIQSRNNFEVSTEYLLTTPAPTLEDAAAAAGSGGGGMEVDLSEEDMMIRAIAMSLGQGMAQGSSHNNVAESEKSLKRKASEEASDDIGGKSQPKMTIQDMEDFSNTIINHTDFIVEGCLSLLDTVPSTVHTVCDLLLAVAKDNVNFYDLIIDIVLDQLVKSAENVIEDLRAAGTTTDPVELKRKIKLFNESHQVKKLTTRMHLYLLMFQEIEVICANAFHFGDLMIKFLEILELTTTFLKSAKENGLENETPDLLAPLILLFDHYEKAVLFTERRNNQECSHVWKWFDDRSGRWCNYSASNNTSIDTAYHAGETTVRFTAGRRRYMVFFKTLVQINEDTGNRRPIMLDVLQEKKPVQTNATQANATQANVTQANVTQANATQANATQANATQAKESTEKASKADECAEEEAIDCTGKTSQTTTVKNAKLLSSTEKLSRKNLDEKHTMDVDVSSKKEEKDANGKMGFFTFQKELIIESLVDLLGLPVNPVTLNAVIRLSLRFTRDYEIACYFVNRNGIENLLNLKDSSSFPGALPLITLLLRHVVEDFPTLQQAVERAVSVAANNGVPNMFCGVGQNSLGAKELHYLLRALGPIACRSVKLYEETIRKMFRLNIPASRRNQVEDVISPNAAQIVKIPQEFKTIGLSEVVSPNSVIKKFVHLLLKTLIERHTTEETISSTAKTSAINAKTEDKKKFINEPKACTPQATLVRRLTGEHIDEEDMTAGISQPPPADSQNLSNTQSASHGKSDQPFLSQTVILRLLTELAKSYAGVASLIVEYHHPVSSTNSKKLVKDGSVLAFIFDHLLPHSNKDPTNQTTDNKTTKPSTTSTLARSLLSVLGAYWHNAEIQSTFVTELKSALLRALHLPECKMKHLRLQAVFNLITSMIESAAPLSFSSQPPLHNSNFIKMLIKRGLISDLARCTHNLDLSSHDLVATVNVMLKPLEKLSNLANSQSVHSTAKSDKDAKQGGSTANNETGSQVNTDSQETEQEEVSQETRSGDHFDSQGGDNDVQDSLQNFEDIVEVMLGSNNETEIFGESLMSSHGGPDNGVEQRIYIEANPMVGNSDSSDSESDSENEGVLSDNLSEGNDYQQNHEPMNEETTSNLLISSQSNAVTSTQQESASQDLAGSASAADDLADTFDIISERHDRLNDAHMEETFIMGGGDDDDDEDDEEHGGVLGGNDDDDDDDDTDDEGNEDDEEGSEMDADDTIAGADDAILFGDEDDATDDVTETFADIDDHGGTLEISFPRRPFAVHIPQMVSDDGMMSAPQNRSSILSHPLLVRNSDQTPRSTASQRPARGRANRGERGFSRQGNTIHVHGGSHSGSFARILVGDDMRSSNRNFDSMYSVGDDIFFDIFGDGNETSSGLLNSVPSALSRWTVESRLLDGSSVHNCVNGLKQDIITYLEKIQKEELKEKLAEEKKKKEESEKKKLLQKEKQNAEKNAETTSGSTATTTTATVSSIATTTTVAPVVSPSSTQPIISTTISSSVPSVIVNTPHLMHRVINTSLWTPPTLASQPALQTDTPSNYVTPFNPLPEIQPNAPVRDPTVSASQTVTATPADGPSSDSIRNTASDIATILGVVPDNSSVGMETPHDVLRLNQLRNNTNVLTADLGFTPAPGANTPHPGMVGASSSFTTPADIPSLQQLRNNSLFSRGSIPVPVVRWPQENVPSPLSRPDPSESRMVSTAPSIDLPPPTTSAALASDLAAAIMSQLVTSSPTPVITTTAQTIDGTAHVSVVTSSTVGSFSSVVPSTTSTNVVNTSQDTPVSQAQASTEPGPGPSGVLRAAEQIQRELEGMGIPEGVDPSFLAALPDSIREEVLREQFGIRLRTTNNGAAPQVSNTDTSDPTEPQEVSPEFLAALPPDVQQEVLEQQRLEQARFTAAQQRPEQPVDPAEFVRNLNPTLRRQVLADMDDTVLAVLPPELSTEAQGLRREIEQRRMQIQAERSLTTRSDFSQLLRHAGLAHRVPGGGFQFARLFPRGQMNSWRVTDGPSGAMGTKKVGRQLLDPESLTCLLVLLFLNDSTLNASRLHRILRNLSYHNASKQWIILALISILRRTSSFHQESTSSNINKSQLENAFVKPKPSKKQKESERSLCEEIGPESVPHNQWLSRTLNLAFGGCINIFQLQKVGRKPTDCFVTVHQQACLDVCKQTLEALSFLAKNFPSSFSPLPEKEDKKDSSNVDQPGPSSGDIDAQSEFWDILVRLNSIGASLKGKAPLKILRDFPKEREGTSFVSSPLGQILSMLSHPVVKQSTMLTDKLLRLLAVISMSLPERPKHLQARTVEVNHQSGPDAHPPEDDAVLPDMPHPIQTVTFADTALPTPQAMLPDQTYYEREQNAADTGTVCSETTSITSSLLVEPPEASEGRIMLHRDVRSPHTGSVISAISDGTVAQSDISGITAENIHGEHDAMDVDHTYHPRSDTSSVDNSSSPALSLAPLSPEKEPAILIGQLRMAVNVLTSGTCSDEGLEDATTLLLQLSRTEPLTRDCILELLLEGGQETADVLRTEISNLLLELKEHNAMNASTKSTDQQKGSKQSVPVIINPASARSQPWRGRGGRAANQNRRFGNFGANQPSRRNVPKPVIYDLHLSMMATLTAKRSTQSLFLRVLKVILQLRDAAKKFAKRPAQSSRSNQSSTRGIRLIERLHHGGSNLREFVAALEADMEAMYAMIDRFGAPETRNQQPTPAEGSGPSSSSQPNENNSAASVAGQLSTETQAGESSKKPEEPKIPQFPRLSTQLNLDELWDVLGETLTELAETTDTNAVLVLQPAVEAYFIVHGSDKDDEKPKDSAEPSASLSSLDIPPSPGPVSPGSALSPSSSGRLGSQSSIFLNLPPDTQKFLRFAETHRTVLNQILRQSNNPLSEGPFAVLVHHTRLLDFDVKRRYFRQELEKEDKGHRREDMAVHIRREHVFEDSYRELHRRTPEELKNRLYIVFDGEEGQDAGGLLREWYGIMAREMFNPNYALFCTSQGEKATYLPNRNSHCNPNHLSYFKFAGRIVAKAIYDNKLLDCYFTRSFYKHILGKPVHYTDMEAEDYGFYQGLVYLLEHDISELGYELTFSLEMQVFGLNEVHDLKANGRNIPVTEETKREYVKYVCQEKMTGSIRQQIDSFLEGFYEIIPRRLISIFDEQELELLVAGLPTIDIEDLKSNTEYHKYTENSLQIQWFWRALRSFEQADRAKFLQFVTGTSKVPLQGFSTLEGMNGVQKFQIHRDDRSTERLPCAHTCFNQLDLPAYETYDKLQTQLLKAIQECPEGFGLA